MKNFEGLLEQIKSCSKKKLAVAVAQDDAVLEAVKAAKDKDIADAILVGDADKIKEIAASMDMSLEGFEIIDVKDPTEAALTAVKLVLCATQACSACASGRRKADSPFRLSCHGYYRSCKIPRCLHLA